MHHHENDAGAALALALALALGTGKGAAAAPPPPPPPPPPLYSPALPPGAREYKAERLTQAIYVLNDRHTIERLPTTDPRWLAPGGLEGLSGWTSRLYRTLPGGKKPAYAVKEIQVENSFGHKQPNRALTRSYPDGTRFDEVLSGKGGKVFEHRMRRKEGGKWESRTLYSDRLARPEGYKGLEGKACASCHNEAGTGKYDDGLVPGGDTVLSDPMDWSAVAGHADLIDGKARPFSKEKKEARKPLPLLLPAPAFPPPPPAPFFRPAPFFMAPGRGFRACPT